MSKQTKTTKSKTNGNTKFSGNRHNVRKRVVTMRTKKLMSWQQIADELEVAPRTARKLFQEQVGEHQHHDHLPNKGGRYPTTAVPTGDSTVLPGDGSVNSWAKVGAESE